MLGNRLKEFRIRSKHTQESLAELVGTNSRQIWRWENGESEPTNDYLVRIATVLDISVDYLLGLTDMPIHVKDNDLTPKEKTVISAMRRGDIKLAVREMVTD